MSQPAEWGSRFVAYLVDIGLAIAIIVVFAILTAIFGAVSNGLGTIVNLFGNLVVFAYWIYNAIYLQGTTGQTIGKAQQGIRLQSDATGQPVGPGMAFVRVIVAAVISLFTCGIGGLLDLLWPLWDKDKKRLTDKVLKFGVVVGGEKGFKLPFM